MKGVSQLIDYVHHLRCAYEYMQGFRRDKPGTNAERIGNKYAEKVEWLYKDLVTNPIFPEQIRNGLRLEWESDTFAIDAIREKIALLLPEHRAAVEAVIESIIKGEKLEIVINETNRNDDDAGYNPA